MKAVKTLTLISPFYDVLDKESRQFSVGRSKLMGHIFLKKICFGFFQKLKFVAFFSGFAEVIIETIVFGSPCNRILSIIAAVYSIHGFHCWFDNYSYVTTSKLTNLYNNSWSIFKLSSWGWKDTNGIKQIRVYFVFQEINWIFVFFLQVKSFWYEDLCLGKNNL